MATSEEFPDIIEDTAISWILHGIHSRDSPGKLMVKGKGGETKIGLKELSCKIMGILQEKKQVNKNLEDMIADEGVEISEKQEKRLKRRIYDVINVFIAMGIVRRMNHSFIYETPESKSLRQRQSDLLRKKLKARQLIEMYTSLKNLCKRNEIRKSSQDPHTVFCPMILLCMGPNSSYRIQTEEKHLLKIEIFGKFKLYQTSEILRQLKLHKPYEIISEELQSILKINKTT